MTLEEIAGKKFLIAVPVCETLEATLTIVHSYLGLHPAGFMVGVGGRLPILNTPASDPCVDFQRLCDFIDRLKKLYPEGIIAVDAEGGNLFNILNGISPLKTAGEYRGCRTNRDGKQELSCRFNDHVREHARLLAQAGVNLNFAPLLDVPRQGYRGYTAADGRSISDMPDEVIWYAREFIRVHGEAGIVCSGKHFPGYGHLSVNPHASLSNEANAWEESRDLLPYRQLIKEHTLEAVMTGHSTTPYHPGIPATLAPESRRLLRGRLGFTGISIADELFMGALNEYYRNPSSGRSDGDPLGESRAVDAWRNNDLIIVSYPVQEADGTVRGVPGGEKRLFRMSEAVCRAVSSGLLGPGDWEPGLRRLNLIFQKTGK
ncbi:glycoside hydrolase family 3 N-terminal domain-containing protein [Salinispira pacifica]|uniref:beta-N-acetylhexosaminidase n=1 Tax=Salinispira pacifica TaxID=1307761 RepID=V5WM85_9SPIO|nr:glycoside hydrolase family 3 N-terminal domain-containing protein [Salinispira pacifica]AHC16730.1 Beta-hexosaminidase [Salinispira pacifica]